MHLKQSGFADRACGAFTKNEEIIQKFIETGDSSYTFKNELDKVCFQHDMGYGDFKDLIKRTASNKVFNDKVLDIDKNPKFDGYQRDLASVFYNFLLKSQKVCY